MYDCAYVIGNSLPFQVEQLLLSFIAESNELGLKGMLLSTVRIGSSDVFAVLQRDWYVTSGTLFISEQIGQAEFLKSLSYFQHHKAMYGS